MVFTRLVGISWNMAAHSDARLPHLTGSKIIVSPKKQTLVKAVENNDWMTGSWQKNLKENGAQKKNHHYIEARRSCKKALPCPGRKMKLSCELKMQIRCADKAQIVFLV